jgi:hypothetical protein
MKAWEGPQIGKERLGLVAGCPKRICQRVKRNIGHLLTHSDLPRPCKPDPAFLHLTPEDLYPVEGSQLSVVFPTHASYTNWGHHRLNLKEVAYALDLPVWLVQDPDKLFFWTNRHYKGLVMPLKPLQIMSQLLLDSLLTAASDSTPIVNQQPGDFVVPTSTWLPAIGKTLPHTWSNPTAVSATAVKKPTMRLWPLASGTNE